MKGLIVVGYQGIGKSSCAGRNQCIDLESGNFFIGGQRAGNWFIPYCQIAMHLANQGYIVFVSSHKVVRDQLLEMKLGDNVGNAVAICPDVSLKDDWIRRLRERYVRTKLEKDGKALLNACDRYTENIQEMEECGLPVYIITDMDYDLMDVVHKAVEEWC